MDPRKALKDYLADWKGWGVDAVPRSLMASLPAKAPATGAGPGHAPGPLPLQAAASSRTNSISTSDLATLRTLVAACTECRLCKTRTQTVFCSGNPSPLMFIGEAPGADEDAQGEVFVGRAGKLLTSILKDVGITRDKVYIANVLKCRPPDNRPPEPDEAAACGPFLKRQIELVNPKVICALGKHAAKSLLGWEGSMGAIRGQWRPGENGRWLTATYHPSYLLRSPGDTETVKADLRAILDRLASLGAHL